jgi:UDP-glucose 4-epimerase
MKLAPPPKFEYSGGDRGWKGDVPIVRLNTDRISKLGWRCKHGSRSALQEAILSMLEDERVSRQ